MKTFTTYAEKKAKQFLNLLQGYTKGIRLTAILILLLMGVSNAWAEPSYPYASLYEVYMSYSYSGNNGEYTYKNTDNGHVAVNLGTLSSDFKITSIYMKVYKNENDWGKTGNICQTFLKYKINNGTEQSIEPKSWSGGTWADERHKYEISMTSSTTIAKYNGASGNYNFTHYFKATGDKEGSDCTDEFYISNNGANYLFTYTITPPAINNFTVTATGHTSGSGTSNDPYIIPSGQSLTLSLSGSKKHTDANSSLQYNTAGTWNTTTSRTISNITSTTAQSVTVKMRCHNSSANLSGTESSKTIYYKAATPQHTINFGVHSSGNGTLTAKAGSTSINSGAQVDQGSKVVFTAEPLTGYEVAGWYSNLDCTTAIAGTSTSTTYTINSLATAATVYVKFKAKQYTIIYKDQNNANFSGTHASGYPTTHTYGIETTLKSATKTGYTFGGWFTNSACTGNAVTSLGATGYTSNITLYAKWTANQYDINYRDQGDANFSGTHASGYPTKHTYGTATELKTATKTDYEFGGWFTTSTCTGSAITTLGATTYTNDITLYAKWTRVYKINYTTQGTGWTYGTKPASAEEGETVTFVVTPATGYRVDVGCSEVALTKNGNNYTFTMPGKDVNIKVEAKPEQYNVTLDNQGATTAGTTSITATYNAAMPSITKPEKTGYTFGGYYTATNGGGTQYYKADGASAKAWTETSVTKLYAKWTANKYSVKFNANGGSGTMSNQSFTYDETKALTTNTFTRKGYDFAGWATSSSGAVQYTDGQSVSNLTETNNSTVNLYAVWNEQEPITVYFRPKTAWKDNSPVIICDGESTAVTPYDCSGDYYTAQVPATTEALKFGGNDEQTLPLTVPTDNKVLYDMKSKTITKLYLKANSNWKADGARFAAYFFGNGEKWVSMTAVAGQTDLYEVAIPTDKSYPSVIFCRMNGGNQTNGWSNKWNQTADLTIPTDGTNRADLPTNVNDGANVTWHKVWDNSCWTTFTAPTYSITKTVGTGGTVTVSKESGITLNEQVTVTVTASNGYTYNSGTITIGTNAATNLAAGTSTHTICGNTEISVEWNANKYSVKFDANDGEGEMANQDFTYDAAAKALTANTFTRTGYTFAGWNTQADGQGTSYTDKQSVRNLTTDNNGVVTLYAQWTPNTYTVKFDKNDGAATGTMTDQSFTYDVAQQLTANAFVKTNWKFAGWNTKADGSGTSYSDQQSVSNLTATNNGVVNLYAQWAPAQDVYTITIRANGNGTVSPESVIVNKSITAEVTATPQDGYKFVGWKTEGGAEVADKELVSTIKVSRTTVTATAAGSVTANFEALLPNTLSLTQQAMYQETDNPWAGGDGTEASPYEIYSEEFVRITAAALPDVEGLTAYYKFGDTPEQESNVFDFSDISGTTGTKITVKAYYKKDDTVWGGEVSADTYYFKILPLPFYVSTVPAGEMSIDRIAAGEDILVQFRSDKKASVNLYVQKDNGARELLTTINNTASHDYRYYVPDDIDPCVLRFIATTSEPLNGRTFEKYAEVALYKNVTIKVNDPNYVLSKVYLWRGGSESELADVKTEWPGEDFIQTFDTWRVFVVKYPYYTRFIVNDGSNENQTFDYEVPSEDKCYQLSATKEHRDEYYNYTLTETTCPSDLWIGDIGNVTLTAGEQKVVITSVAVGLGYQISDVKTTVSSSNTGIAEALVSGTNIIIIGKAAGTATITVTYELDGTTVTKTFKVTVERDTHITIQVKVPIGSSGTQYDNIGWSDNSKLYIHYWFSNNTNANIELNYIGEETGKYKYLQAKVPLHTDGKTNFLVYYEFLNDEVWRKSPDVKNVTTDGCYTMKNEGYEKQPSISRAGDFCWEEDKQYQVKILMQNGKEYTSNIVRTTSETLSFFAPGCIETGYKAGAVILYSNNAVVAAIDPATFASSNVYTATINETGDGLANVKPYTGNYYIRTWGRNDDINNKGIQSVSTWTDEEKKSRTFTYFISREGEFYNHYWVQTMNPHDGGKDVYAWVANDYNDDLAGKLTKGKGTDDNGNIKFDNSINVRFGYDPRTNYFGRAILKGSTSESNYHHNFLNIHCNNAYTDKNCTNKLPYGSGQSGQENMMQDISNWVYQRDFYVPITNSNPSASLYIEATSPSNVMSVTDHLLGYVTNEVTGEEDHTKPVQRTIIGSGTTNGTYLMRVVYDFKTNRIIAAWLPQGTIEVSKSETLNSDVLFVRKENEDVPQINLSGDGKIKSLESMFFAIELHRGNTDKNQRHQEQYWFTLPFDCKVGSISGVHGYMQIWGIQRYNGKKRAENGWFNPSTTFWEWLTPDDVMHAGEGYLLVFDKKTAPWNEIEVVKTDADGNIIYEKDANGNIIYENDKPKAVKETISLMRLYFPSTESGFDMQQQSEEQLTRTYQNHTCTITTANRDLQDSNWKVIGTTSYNNAGISGYTKDSDPAYKELSDAPSFRYQYEYTMSDDNKTFWYKYTPENGQTATYKSFYGYMVQFAGTINWQPIMSETVPDHIAARRYVPANERTSYTTRLELANAAGELQDLTFVALDEKATIGFDQNKDLNKVLNRGTNIYTFVEGLPFAGNTLPMEKATVPVGVRAATAGEYTFRMPDGTDGIAVTLVDNATGTHTNMLMSEYTVTLNAGTIENRFYLVVDPDRTATSVENIGEEADKSKGVEKFLIDGKLFIRTADGIFDAKGQRL